MYLRLNFSWKSKALNLRQPQLSASYKESVAASVSNVQKKVGESDFSHKNGGVGKIGEVVFKKVGIAYFHTNWPFPVLSFSECLVRLGVCVLFI